MATKVYLYVWAHTHDFPVIADHMRDDGIVEITFYIICVICVIKV